MKKLLPVIYFLILLPLGSIYGQGSTYFKVVVGSFIDAKLLDFESIQPYGFVHAEQQEGNLYQVYIGGYNTRADADRTLRRVKDKGYQSAYIEARNAANGQTVTVIQLASKKENQTIEWNRYLSAGNLYAIINDGKLKIVTPPFNSMPDARSALNAIKKKGFKDAFIKKVNSIFIHPISRFELQEPDSRIPTSFNNTTSERGGYIPGQNQSNNYPVYQPNIYDTPGNAPLVDDITSLPVLKEYSTAPTIRSKIKRRSAMELQKALKLEQVYQGSLDGYYGSGTSSSYESVMASNRQLQKYAILAVYMDQPSSGSGNSNLQQAINNLPTNSDAQRFIEGSNAPIALAYRAYMLFARSGPSNNVNELMNAAIRQAFVGRNLRNQPPFDYTATYAYTNLDQLIQHLHYIHGAPDMELAVPCWLFQQHPTETARAYEAIARSGGSGINLQSCDGFLNWEPVRILQLIAADLNPDPVFDTRELSEEASRRARLFLTPRALSQREQQAVEIWNQQLWRGLDAWGSQDPMNKRLTMALRLTYFQAQVLLEDFFMDKGFKLNDASSLAMATLQNVVGYHLERFI